MTRIGSVLVAALGDSLEDDSALVLQREVAERVVATRASAVLLDISGLDIVDSFISKVLADTASIVRVLGAEVALVGMRPAVAITLVEVGLPMGDVVTGRNVDHGIRLLAARADQRAASERAGRRDKPSGP